MAGLQVDDVTTEVVGLMADVTDCPVAFFSTDQEGWPQIQLKQWCIVQNNSKSSGVKQHPDIEAQLIDPLLYMHCPGVNLVLFWLL